MFRLKTQIFVHNKTCKCLFNKYYTKSAIVKNDRKKILMKYFLYKKGM